MSRRLPKSLPGPKLETRDPDAPTPCLDNSHPFDVLIEKAAGPEYRYARRLAASMCRACPVRARCHADNADETWVQRLHDTSPAPDVPTRDCLSCGETFVIGPRQGQKRYCSDACNKASLRAGVKVTETAAA